jgi:hypothetical protein
MSRTRHWIIGGIVLAAVAASIFATGARLHRMRIRLIICVMLGAVVSAHGLPASHAIQKGTAMTRATGTFDVKLAPQGTDDKAEGTSLGRMSIDKRYHGDLDGAGKGEMLTAGTPVNGSAGYVAMERVSGTMQGRRGTFILQHDGTLARGTPHLAITVVPDSGTGQLSGLTGTMTIAIADGKHSYEFTYSIAAPER